MRRARARPVLELQQQAQHVAVQFAGRRRAAIDPVEQPVVVFGQQSFVALQLSGREFRQIFARESAQEQVALLGAAVMALIEQPLALLLHRLVRTIHALDQIRAQSGPSRRRDQAPAEPWMAFSAQSLARISATSTRRPSRAERMPARITASDVVAYSPPTSGLPPPRTAAANSSSSSAGVSLLANGMLTGRSSPRLSIRRPPCMS